MAALPAKFVRYRTFGRAVTTSASRPSCTIAPRRRSCLRLSAAVGACAMECGEPLPEGSEAALRPLALGIVDRHVDVEFPLHLLERQPVLRLGPFRGHDLPCQVVHRLLEIRIVAGQ